MSEPEHVSVIFERVSERKAARKAATQIVQAGLLIELYGDGGEHDRALRDALDEFALRLVARTEREE
jgi:hypothetical protein